MKITRREAMILLGGASVTIAACGGGPAGPSSQDDTAAEAAAPTGSKIGRISENHRHTAIIGAAQLEAGGALLLDITGTSDHPHTVVLSADDVAQIRNGGRVARVSSNDDRHTHV